MKESKVFGVVGIVLGITIIIFGFIVLGKIESDYKVDENTSFGGDFYTYEYKATRVAAKNTDALATGIGFLLLAIGGTDILYFGSVFVKKPIQNLDQNGTTIVRIEATQSEELFKVLKETGCAQSNDSSTNVRDELPPL